MKNEVEEIRRFIEENPEFKEILERAVEHERMGDEKEYYLGWQWSDVRAHPAKLMKCVTSGVCKINYKSRRYTHYKLINRKAVEEALGINKEK